MTQQLETQTIAGHEITLEKGRRYYASRPCAGSRTEYPVSIYALGSDGCFENEPTLVISKLNLETATGIINAFNNEEVSLTGREW